VNRLQKISARLAREGRRKPPGKRSDSESIRLRNGRWRKIVDRLARFPHRYDD